MPLPTSLDGRTAIVTGGAMGIGRTIAQSLVARGLAVSYITGEVIRVSGAWGCEVAFARGPASSMRGGTACRPDLAAGRI